jgi:glucose/arabinose dehydrogenase
VTRMRRTVLGVVVLMLAIALPATAGAAVKRKLIGNFNVPIQVAAPSWVPGSTIYVAEQPGYVIRWRSGQRNTVLDIHGRVQFSGERGLLSIAFGPHRRMFVYYTNRDGNLRVASYTLTRGGGHVKAGSGRTIFKAVHTAADNHNGGTLQFRGGHLYLSTGDGGGGCNDAVPGSAQDLGSKLGKLLRRDSGRWKVVGYGLRNPWRWSFDRKTGDLYIGDVGQSSREEIDFLPASRVGGRRENYGWNHYEGSLEGTCPNDEGIHGDGVLTFPRYQYGRSIGSTVIGGYVYRGRSMPGQRGRYFFGDNGAGWVKSADARTLKDRRKLFDVSGVYSFGENSKGELFVVSGAGPVYKLHD